MAPENKPEKKIDKKYVETPLMKQYYSIKAVHPDAILLFRVGDFYETFGDDAIKASGILGITLTRRANGAATYVELAGFPYHAIDTYLPKLVRAGERVAICEQLEDPKLVKGLVKRGVIELVTPGIVLGDNILANKENNYIASVYFGRRTTGVAFLDISTGEFYVAEGDDAYVDKLISNLAPKEVIYQRGYEDRFSAAFGSRLYTYRLDEWVFSEEVNREKLCRQFGTPSLKGFGVDHLTSGISAAGAILYYLEFTEHRETGHITSIARIDQDDYVWIDKFTIRNLELFSSNGAREKCSFADVIDRTLTPMGGRLLKRWIAMPIKDPARINERLDVVERFTQEADLADAVREQVSMVGDLERIASRIAAQRVTPRELVQLKNSLSAIETLKAAIESTDCRQLHTLAEGIDPMTEVRDRIAREIYPDPLNNQIQKGGVIADGVNPSWTTCAASPCTARTTWPASSSARARRRGSRRSRSATTTSSATTSRCAMPTRRRFPPAGSANRPSPTPSATSPRSSRSTKRRSSAPRRRCSSSSSASMPSCWPPSAARCSRCCTTRPSWPASTACSRSHGWPSNGATCVRRSTTAR